MNSSLRGFISAGRPISNEDCERGCSPSGFSSQGLGSCRLLLFLTVTSVGEACPCFFSRSSRQGGALSTYVISELLRLALRESAGWGLGEFASPVTLVFSLRAIALRRFERRAS